MIPELSWVPPEVDVTVPNPARVYDYWLDGDHHFPADRELGEQILKIMPGVRDAAGSTARSCGGRPRSWWSRG